MTVKEILADWLKSHGYDGLCSDDCGCEISELCPCLWDIHDCVAGHKVKCTPECDHEFINGKDGWHIEPGPRKGDDASH